MSGLVAAARFLTIVPFPGPRCAEGERLGAAAPWFPVVGLGIGIVVVAADRAATFFFPTLLAALVTVTVWKVLTGGLHLDGLADCLDGLAGLDSEHRLAIMRDSRIGAFGVLGLILFLLLEIAAVAELPQASRWRVLLAAPAIGRAMPALVARAFPPARPQGHGATFRLGVRVRSAVLALAIGAAVAFAALGMAGAAALAVAIILALGAAGFMAARLRGVTGDVLGASVEVAELATLLTVSGWAHVRLS